MDLFLQQLLNGLTLGMVYALIALGYTMVYGIIQLINFAHGEIFMSGAFLSLTALALVGVLWPGAPFLVVLFAMFAVSIVGCGVLGVTIEKTAYRKLRNSPKLAALISSIGISFFLQNAVMLLYGSREQTLPELIPPMRWNAGPVSVSLMQVLIFLTSISLMIGLNFFVKKTRLGKAMRALAENPEAACLMGISVNRVVQVTFVIGSALAAVAGILFGLNYGSINFHDGYLAGLKAFTAAVFGGIGSVPGAMLGGILLGIFEGLGAGYVSSEWKDAFAFFLLIAVLLVKPSGLLGENVPEKV